jgi:predicted  nucleic acid-binding Zn-ribbon protein
MSDDADVPHADRPDAEDDTDTVVARLLALQEIDTEADRLRLRLERLDERPAAAARRDEVADWERRLATYERRTEELDAAIDAEEHRGKDLDALKHRLEGQLRTIIAPREAEALMHEIATVDAQRDANETEELEALEEQAEIEGLLVAHRADEQAHRDRLAEAERALAAAEAEVGAALTEVEARRDGARAGIGAATLANYDRLRGQLGVAVSRLEGKMCSGCHLDLSAAEIDTARDVAAAGEGIADCPQCGRILVP